MKKALFYGGMAFACIALGLIVFKGAPKDEVSLNAVAELAESVLRHADKTTKVFVDVSAEEEMRVGEEIHKKVSEKMIAEGIVDTPLDRYISQVGRRVAEHVKRKEIDYKFHIIDSIIPNAKAAPGGHIYITLGLLAALNTEAELAAVLGHEIAHVDAGHAIDAIKNRIAMQKTNGGDLATYTDIGYAVFVKAGYSEYEEIEADQAGVYLAVKAGYHPYAIIHAFQNVFQAKQGQGKAEWRTPVGDTLMAVGGLMARYFGTHPETEERIRKIRRYIQEKNLYEKDRKYAVGIRNRRDLVAIKDMDQGDQWFAEYPEIDNAEENTKDNEPTEVNEIYTVYGRLYVGMDLKQLKKVLPGNLKVFEHDNRLGYKSVLIYGNDLSGRKIRRGVWIERDVGMVTKIKLMD